MKKPEQLAKVVFYGREVDAQFPPKDQVIPKQFDSIFNLKCKALKKHSDWICKLSERPNTEFKFNKNTLDLICESIECEMTYKVIEGVESMKPIGFNIGYVQESLKHQFGACDDIEVCLSAPLDPMVMRRSDGVDSLVVIMPMRI